MWLFGVGCISQNPRCTGALRSDSGIIRGATHRSVANNKAPNAHNVRKLGLTSWYTPIAERQAYVMANIIDGTMSKSNAMRLVKSGVV